MEFGKKQWGARSHQPASSEDYGFCGFSALGVDVDDRRPKALSTLVPASRVRGSGAPRRHCYPHHSLPFGSQQQQRKTPAVSSSSDVGDVDSPPSAATLLSLPFSRSSGSLTMVFSPPPSVFRRSEQGSGGGGVRSGGSWRWTSSSVVRSSSDGECSSLFRRYDGKTAGGIPSLNSVTALRRGDLRQPLPSRRILTAVACWRRGGVSLPPSTNSRHSVVRQLAHATGETGKEDEDAEVAVPTCSARRRGCGSRSPTMGEDRRVVTLPAPSENREGRHRFSLAFVSCRRRRKLEEWTPRPDPPPPSAIDELLKLRPEDGNGSLVMLGCRFLVVCV
nr:hypothetical protein Itr_chr04CG16060 [Ipomoea trifida]